MRHSSGILKDWREALFTCAVCPSRRQSDPGGKSIAPRRCAAVEGTAGWDLSFRGVFSSKACSLMRDFRQTIAIGVNQQLEPIRNLKLGIYGSKVMMHGNITDE